MCPYVQCNYNVVTIDMKMDWTWKKIIEHVMYVMTYITCSMIFLNYTNIY